MLIDPPRRAWYRPGERPPAGQVVAEDLRGRDAATARAIQAYLATRPTTAVPSRVQTVL